MFSSGKKSTPKVHDKYIISNRVLGKGAYAEVKLARCIANNQTVAVKIIDKVNIKPNDMKKLYKEVRILKTLRHSNVVRVEEYFDEEDNFYIVMEYVAGGELFTQIVDKQRKFTERESRRIIGTLAQALKYCKDNGVVHRDLKPENVLMTSDDDDAEIKIVDFNLAKKIDPEVVEYSIIETMCGTPNYVAPEVISGSPYDYKCDVWSLGVISYLLISGGYLPFYVNLKREQRKDLLMKVKAGRWKFSPDKAWNSVSPLAKDFITKLLCKNPEERYSYEQILGHPWFKNDSVSLDTEILVVQMDEMNKMRLRRKLQVAATLSNALSAFEDFMHPSPESTMVLTHVPDAGSGGWDTDEIEDMPL